MSPTDFTNFNTLEGFKNSDKVELLKKSGEKVWNDIISLEALKVRGYYVHILT